MPCFILLKKYLKTNPVYLITIAIFAFFFLFSLKFVFFATFFYQDFQHF